MQTTCPQCRRSNSRCHRRTECRSSGRAAFTLIELLVVIVIVGMLVGLIVPAVMRAVGTAKEAAVASEIQALGQALASFKNTYGDFPPSRLVCSESGKYDASTLGVLAPLGPRSLQALRRFWPRATFTTDGSAPPIPSPFYYDFNGNDQNDSTSTAWGKPYLLSGAECLVFFLGGIPQQLGTGEWGMTGFSKNPANPFINPIKTNNRIPPIHEFVSSRLLAYPNEFNDGQGSPSGFPAFLDSLGTYNYRPGDASTDGAVPFYCYFSAYGGTGYDPDDVNMRERDSATTSPLKGAFVSNNAPTKTVGAVAVPGGLVSFAPNPYTNGPPVQTAANGKAETTLALLRPRVWQNAQTFQIVSAGRDRVFGMGGQYAANAPVKLPFVAVNSGSAYTPDSFQTVQATADMYPFPLGGDARARESDNLANFSQGKLE